MATTKKDIEEMHRLVERLEEMDELLDALSNGKQLHLGWGGTIATCIMVGSVEVPPTAHKELQEMATKWRDEARAQLDMLGVEWRQDEDDLGHAGKRG